MLRINHKNDLFEAANRSVLEQERQHNQRIKNRNSVEKWRQKFFLATCIFPKQSKIA